MGWLDVVSLYVPGLRKVSARRFARRKSRESNPSTFNPSTFSTRPHSLTPSPGPLFRPRRVSNLTTVHIDTQTKFQSSNPPSILCSQWKERERSKARVTRVDETEPSQDDHPFLSFNFLFRAFLNVQSVASNPREVSRASPVSLESLLLPQRGDDGF